MPGAPAATEHRDADTRTLPSLTARSPRDTGTAAIESRHMGRDWMESILMVLGDISQTRTRGTASDGRVTSYQVSQLTDAVKDLAHKFDAMPKQSALDALSARVDRDDVAIGAGSGWRGSRADLDNLMPSSSLPEPATMRVLLLLALLTGCAAPPRFPECPGPVAVPAALHPREMVGTLEIRVELAREAERNCGDRCATSAAAMKKWIEQRNNSWPPTISTPDTTLSRRPTTTASRSTSRRVTPAVRPSSAGGRPTRTHEEANSILAEMRSQLSRLPLLAARGGLGNSHRKVHGTHYRSSTGDRRVPPRAGDQGEWRPRHV